MIRLEPPTWYRHAANIMIAAASAGAVYWTHELLDVIRYVEEAGMPRLIIQMLEVALFLGLIPIGWAIYSAVVTPRTRLIFSDAGLRLEHPWRIWTGSWSQVRRAYELDNRLCIQTDTDRWWSVYLGRKRPHAPVEDFRAMVGPGRWLTPRAARRFIAWRALPLILIMALLGAAALHVVKGTLKAELARRGLPPPAAWR